MIDSAGIDLRGSKVRVRSFTATDVTDTYVGWLNDALVTRFSNQRFRHHDRQSCESYLASFDGSPNLFLSIRRLADDSAIGTMTVYRQPHHGTADVGIMVGERTVWGLGYGQEAWDLVIGWLLQSGDIRKVTAGTLAVNIGMVRLMERSGMLHEATRRAQELVDGEPVDIVHHARFRDA